MSSQREMNRRDLIKSIGIGTAAMAVSPFLSRALQAAETTRQKKVLFFTKSQGFPHDTVKRKSPTELSFAEKLLTEIGEKNGIAVTCSKDGSLFTPEYLAGFDALAFYTTGDLTKDSPKDRFFMAPKLDADGKPMKDAKGKIIMEKGEPMKEPGMGDAGKAAFLDAIKNGKGFMGFHCATDTFHSHGHQSAELIRDINVKGEDQFDPYIQMIGGEFITHGSQQDAVLQAVDSKFPGAAAFDKAKFPEEWYSLKNFAPNLHVILTQNCTGMRGGMYQRDPYPETWARMHGKGRVFYTSMGHREDVWTRPEFEGLVGGALKWITGQVEVDVTPNIKEVAPHADPKPFGK